MYTLLVWSVCLVWGVQGGLAPFIKPCKASDRKCLKDSAQKAVPVLAAGIPQLELKALDPMLIEHIKASQAGLDMEFRNTIVKGFRNCEVLNVQRLPQKTLFDMKCTTTMIGDYKLSGRLLVMPIQGEGKYKVKIRDMLVKMVLDIDEKTINGEQYWSISNWKYTYEVLTNAQFQFQNMFNGQKELSDAVHAFANANWQGIFQDVAPPVMNDIIGRVIAETKKFFNKVPIKDLSL